MPSTCQTRSQSQVRLLHWLFSNLGYTLRLFYSTDCYLVRPFLSTHLKLQPSVVSFPVLFFSVRLHRNTPFILLILSSTLMKCRPHEGERFSVLCSMLHVQLVHGWWMTEWMTGQPKPYVCSSLWEVGHRIDSARRRGFFEEESWLDNSF